MWRGTPPLTTSHFVQFVPSSVGSCELGFQLIIPYLQKFMQLNPGSTVRYEMDGNNISHIFVCPGIMKTTMKNVRPVMSLDAAHLKSKWKGILYTASVMTASNNVYPVAIAITHGNENESGWNWFLGLLDNAIDVLKMDHPRSEVRYKYFTFISDRQKTEGSYWSVEQCFPTKPLMLLFNTHSKKC